MMQPEAGISLRIDADINFQLPFIRVKLERVKEKKKKTSELSDDCNTFWIIWVVLVYSSTSLQLIKHGDLFLAGWFV